MQSSDSFYIVLQNNNNIDRYLLLPDTWQEMSTEHKTAAVEILNKHKCNVWGVDCCRMIPDAVCVPLSEIHTLQPAIFLSMVDPSHLTCGYEDVYLNNDGKVADVDPQIVRV